MIIFESNLKVVKNNRKWIRGVIGIPPLLLEDLGIHEVGDNDVLVVVIPRGEVFDIKEIREKKLLFDRIREVQDDLNELRKEVC